MLAQLKARKLAIDAREKAAATKKNRADDIRRKLLIGAAVLNQCEGNPDAHERMIRMMDSFLTRESDRVLFELDKK